MRPVFAFLILLILATHPCRMQGGILRTSGSGEILLRSGSSTRNLTNEGTMHIQRYSAVHMSGTLINNGYINQGDEGLAGSADVHLDSSLIFDGGGILRVGDSNTLKMYNWPTASALLTNSAQHTIESHGGRFGELPNYYGDQRINLLNEGTIICDESVYATEFRLADEGFVNRGTLEFQPDTTNTPRIWGNFHQSEGLLKCDSNFRITDGVFSFTGGVLAGQSGLQGAVTLGGEAVIHPGEENEIGTLNIWGPLTLNQGATLVCEWGHQDKDRLAVHGLLSTTGTVRLRIEYRELEDLRLPPDFTVLTCEDLDDQAEWTVELPAGWSYDDLVWEGNSLVVKGLDGMVSATPELPAELALHGATPNPFNPQTQVSFSLNREGLVKIWVADLAGRRVRTLVHETYPTGRHQVLWDGRDRDGRAAGSGTYLCVMEAAGHRQTSRMTLVR